MAIFDRFGLKKQRGRRFNGAEKPWWEVAEEFSPESLYDPSEEYGSFDPLGSYTGVPADGGEPVQDADDL